MTRIPSITAAVGLLTTALLLAAPASARPGTDDRFEELQREIAALRVLHAMELSAEQAEALTPLVEEGVALADDLHAVHEQHRADGVAVLERVRDDLADDGVLEPETEALARDARQEAFRAAQPVLWELRDLGEELATLLDDEQKEAAARAAMPPDGRRGPPGGPGGPDGDGPMDAPGLDEEGDGGPQGEAPAALQQRMRRHAARHLAMIVFTQEFLDALRQLP